MIFLNLTLVTLVTLQGNEQRISISSDEAFQGLDCDLVLTNSLIL